MRHTLSDIEEIINSTNSAQLVPVKCDNCGSKIKPGNLGKHSECSIFRNHHSKTFLNRESFPSEVKLKPPTKLQMFIVGTTAHPGYQSIAPSFSKHPVQSLIIPQPQPDLPIQQQANIQIEVVEQYVEQNFDPSQLSINIHDKTAEKQNFDNLSIYSKKEELLPTTAREDRTARGYQYQAPVSVISTARSRHFLQEQITYRPTVNQQMFKQTIRVQNTPTSQTTGLLSFFSCMTEHGAAIKQNQISSEIKSNVCPCCLREAHQFQQHSSSTLNNFQIQRKKILYDRWLEARARYKSIPSISFQEAFKRHRLLKQQQFCSKIRQYFY